MNAEAIYAVLDACNFPGYVFMVGGLDRHYIQASFIGRCTVEGCCAVQHTRKWYVSDKACKSEIVQTALKLVLTSVEHEAREVFTYRGLPIFGPHFDVDALHGICASGALERRA